MGIGDSVILQQFRLVVVFAFVQNRIHFLNQIHAGFLGNFVHHIAFVNPVFVAIQSSCIQLFWAVGQ